MLDKGRIYYGYQGLIYPALSHLFNLTILFYCIYSCFIVNVMTLCFYVKHLCYILSTNSAIETKLIIIIIWTELVFTELHTSKSLKYGFN